MLRSSSATVFSLPIAFQKVRFMFALQNRMLNRTPSCERFHDGRPEPVHEIQRIRTPVPGSPGHLRAGGWHELVKTGLGKPRFSNVFLAVRRSSSVCPVSTRAIAHPPKPAPVSLAPSAPPASASSTKASSSRVEISKSSREAWEAYIRRPTSWKSPALSARTASITRAFSVTMCLARSSSSPETPKSFARVAQLLYPSALAALSQAARLSLYPVSARPLDPGVADQERQAGQLRSRVAAGLQRAAVQQGSPASQSSEAYWSMMPL